MQNNFFSTVTADDETNLAIISGRVVKTPEVVYTSGKEDEKFDVYAMEVAVRRTSGKEDIILVKYPEYITGPADSFPTGAEVEASGAFRSRNLLDADGKRITEHYIYAREIDLVSFQEDKNQVFLDGFVCAEPKYRVNLQGRKIATLMLAANSPNGRSDYIPCVCWGNTADLAKDWPAGAEVEFEGRLESREYMKNGRTRTVREVAVRHINVVFLPQ